MWILLTERIHLGELCEGGVIAAGTIVVPVKTMHAVQLFSIVFEWLETLISTRVAYGPNMLVHETIISTWCYFTMVKGLGTSVPLRYTVVVYRG